MDPNNETLHSKPKLEKFDKLNFYFRQFIGDYKKDLGKVFEEQCKDMAAYELKFQYAGVYYDDPNTRKDKCRACIGFVVRDDEKSVNEEKLCKLAKEKNFSEGVFPESVAGKITSMNTNPDKVADVEAGIGKLIEFMRYLLKLDGKSPDQKPEDFALLDIYPAKNISETIIPIENVKEFMISDKK